MDALLASLEDAGAKVSAVLEDAKANPAPGDEDDAPSEAHTAAAKRSTQLAYALGSMSFMICRCLVSHDRAGADAVPAHHPARMALSRVQASMARVRDAKHAAAPESAPVRVNAAAAARILAAKGRQVAAGADGSASEAEKDSDSTESESDSEDDAGDGKGRSRGDPGTRRRGAARKGRGGRDEDRMAASRHAGAIGAAGGAAAAGSRRGKRSAPEPKRGHLDWRERMKKA